MKITFLILFFIYSASASYLHKPAEDLIKLSCSITSKKKVYKLGERPSIEVKIVNKDVKNIYLIGSLEGSELQWRMPFCYFTIIKPKLDTPKMIMRCGNTNSLKPEDFKLVKPGQAFDPYERIGNDGYFQNSEIMQIETFRNPGVYKIKFHYSTNSIDINKFSGTPTFLKNEKDNIQIDKYFKKVPKIDLVSNTIEIEITE